MTELPPIEIDPKTFLREHCTLPALPEIVTEIQRLIQDGGADMGDVADLVKGEPALAAQVLKVVNSAYYGLPREVPDVKFAVAFLGLSEIYRIVLSLSVVNTLSIHEKGELDKFWFHSFYAAVCTKHLAKKHEPLLSFEQLWSAAILHDIGKLVYLKFFPDHYKTLQHFCKQDGSLFSEAERHFSLPSSGFLGALLCHHWRLPDHIKRACEFHTLRDLPNIDGDGQSARFQRMICLGNLVAILSANELKDAKKHEIASAIMAAFDCSESEFLAMMGDIYELRLEVEKFAGQFH